LYNEGNKNAIAVNSTKSATSKSGMSQTTISSSYWANSDPETQPTVTTFDGSELLLLDEEGPFDRNNDPFEKMRTEFEKTSKPKNGPVMLQLEESGPFDRSSNPFEQFRNGPPAPAPEPAAPSGPFDRSNNPFEQFRTPPPAAKK
jgi:hypothetical protein